MKVCLHSKQTVESTLQFDELFDKNCEKFEFCDFEIFWQKFVKACLLQFDDFITFMTHI